MEISIKMLEKIASLEKKVKEVELREAPATNETNKLDIYRILKEKQENLNMWTSG